MPIDRESNEIKKSMAYDLIDIIESSEGKESYTPELCCGRRDGSSHEL